MSPVKKIYIAVIFFLLVTVLLISFLIYPSFSAIRENSQALLQEKNKIAFLVQEEEGREKLENFYQLYKQDLASLEAIFFDVDLPLDFINFLEESANQTQVQIRVSSIKKDVNKEDSWPILLIQLAIVGHFPNSSEFLERLETGPYLAEVLDLSVKKLTESEIRLVDLHMAPLADTTTILNIKTATK